MITITVKGLAKFMTATQAGARKVVKEFKYPDELESAAQQKYYREARRHIKAFHEHGHSVGWLTARADALTEMARREQKQRRTRLLNNARGIHAYAQYFSKKKFDILDGVSYTITFGAVRIKVTPDLHVTEGTQERLIKLEFGTKTPTTQHVRTICQVMYEAAQQNGLELRSGSILYLDVPRGTAHKGARAGARTLAEIQAACENIAAIWNTI